MNPGLGSISQGTMRARDLIPAFAGELERLDNEGKYVDLVAECNEMTDEDYDSEDIDTIEEIGDLSENLFDALDSFAPPYAYFGSHEGDGADYGFWISWDAIEDAVYGKELLKVNDLADIPEGYHGEVLVVNDHGNATLYTPVIEYKPVWSDAQAQETEEENNV